MKRVYNFNAGPSTLPLEVLEQAQAELTNYQNSGMSIMEMSHRGKVYESVHNEAQENLRKIFNIPQDYAILFLQGGASEQFCWVPLNFLKQGETADYVLSGSWADKSIKEAKLIGQINIAADSSKEKPARLPDPNALKLTPNASYLHITSNETIEGIQWKTFPKSGAPLVADMSSDILSRPVDVSQFGLIYAGAQKNLGPSGVTIVILRKDWAEKGNDLIPKFFRYSTHIKENSLYNTPPTFGIYVLMLVTRWIINKGGLDKIASQNCEKAKKLYSAIDGSKFYKGTAIPEFRSDMNVTFRLPGEELEEKFVKEAQGEGMIGLKGHRSVGGIRASVYNAFPPEGVETLISFMKDFEKKNG